MSERQWGRYAKRNREIYNDSEKCNYTYLSKSDKDIENMGIIVENSAMLHVCIELGLWLRKFSQEEMEIWLQIQEHDG